MQMADLTRAVEQVDEKASAMQSAYQDDEDMGDLKSRAIDIRDAAQGLVDVFDAVNNGLGML